MQPLAIHYSDVPPGQARYVTCVAGAVLDAILSEKDAAAPALEEALRSSGLPSYED